MSRGNTTDQITAQQANIVRPVQLVRMDFSSGDLFLHSGTGEFSFGGNTYLGVGGMGAISAATEDASLARNTRTFTLSGIPTGSVDLRELATTDLYLGRNVWHYGLFVNEQMHVIDDQVYLWRGRMDTLSFELGESATITLSAESRLADWDRPRSRRYTDPDQQNEYPGDLAFEFNSQAAEFEIRWMI